MTRFIDTFALESEVNAYLTFNTEWQAFDSPTKEAWIQSVSVRIDNLLYDGLVKVDGQPMKFPREYSTYNFGDNDNIFDESEQIRTLIRAVSYQVEFDLNRNGIGMTSQSLGDASVVERQEVICRETLQVLNPYLLKQYG